MEMLCCCFCTVTVQCMNVRELFCVVEELGSGRGASFCGLSFSFRVLFFQVVHTRMIMNTTRKLGEKKRQQVLLASWHALHPSGHDLCMKSDTMA